MVGCLKYVGENKWSVDKIKKFSNQDLEEIALLQHLQKDFS